MYIVSSRTQILMNVRMAPTSATNPVLTRLEATLAAVGLVGPSPLTGGAAMVGNTLIMYLCVCLATMCVCVCG